MAEEIPDYIKDRINAFLNCVVSKIPNLSLRIIGDMDYNMAAGGLLFAAKFKIELGENVCSDVIARYEEHINRSKNWYAYELLVFDLSNKFLSTYRLCTTDAVFVKNKKYKVCITTSIEVDDIYITV